MSVLCVRAASQSPPGQRSPESRTITLAAKFDRPIKNRRAVEEKNVEEIDATPQICETVYENIVSDDDDFYDRIQTLKRDNEEESIQMEQNSDVSDDVTLDSESQTFSPLKTIEDMWENFSVDDYVDRRSLSRRGDTWPHVTVPKPFQMTLREEKEAPAKQAKRAKIAEEIRRQKLAEEVEGEVELRKKFRARPMPATTLIPMYEAMKEKSEMRRAHVRAVARDLVDETEKPFRFMEREERRKEARRAELMKSPSSKKTRDVTKARPVPREIFDSRINDEIREEEEYRKIRIRMRAEETLAAAALPRSMQVKGRDYTIGPLRYQLLKERESKAFLTNDHHFRPEVNQSVPDFNQLQRQMNDDLVVAKERAKTTTVEPFFLRTALIPSRRDKVFDEMKRDDYALPETRWPFSLPRGKPVYRAGTYVSPAADSMATRSTTSSRLRESVNRSSLNEKRWKEIRAADCELRLAEKQKLLARAVARRSRANDRSAQLRASTRERINEYKESDWKRREEYRNELEEIEERLSQRPFLFERESQVNARRSAQRKYAKALESAGVDEEEIEELVRYDDENSSQDGDEDRSAL
ncbi:protein FAM161A-like [Oscarella lobularis]|uniref:protein FAM161A-like n=1 Tax=Oscarella lobularis TaxID=121494 RepID=UPI003313CA53